MANETNCSLPRPKALFRRCKSLREKLQEKFHEIFRQRGQKNVDKKNALDIQRETIFKEFAKCLTCQSFVADFFGHICVETENLVEIFLETIHETFQIFFSQTLKKI